MPLLRILAGITFAASVFDMAHGAERPVFDLPLDCTKAPSCLLQNMVDMVPGPKVGDPYCGRATFDGHKGTDIRLRDLREMQQGIPVLAMADGVVVALRDGMSDRLVRTKADRQRVRSVECGNGFRIDHGTFGGQRWSSQTCHLARGSIRVKRGDKVTRGQELALMGLSGMTQFPHVHVTIRAGDVVLDPMTGRRSTESCEVSAPGPLWSKAALELLEASDSPLVAAGFSNGPVRGGDVMTGKVARPGRQGALTFYSQFKNLKKGDQIRLQIFHEGKQFVDQTTQPLDRSKATYTAYAGKRRRPATGPFSARVILLRDGRPVFEKGGYELR